MMGKAHNINASLEREITKFCIQVHVAKEVYQAYIFFGLKGKYYAKMSIVKQKQMKISSYHLRKQKDLGKGIINDKFLPSMVRASVKTEMEFVLTNVEAVDIKSYGASNIGGMYESEVTNDFNQKKYRISLAR